MVNFLIAGHIYHHTLIYLRCAREVHLGEEAFCVSVLMQCLHKLLTGKGHCTMCRLHMLYDALGEGQAFICLSSVLIIHRGC